MARFKPRDPKAAALKYYGSGRPAPEVVAKGTRVTARRIIEIAKENDIPVVASPDIVEILIGQDVNTLIPQELFKAVAEIYAYIFKVKNSHD